MQASSRLRRAAGLRVLLCALVVLVLAACAPVRPQDSAVPSDDASALVATAVATGSPADIVREAYGELTAQLFRESSARELLAPAWKGINAEARRQGLSAPNTARHEARGSDDIDGFVREFSDFLNAEGQGLDGAALARAAVKAMAGAIGDSHTRFLTPEEEEAQQRAADGDASYVGIGVALARVGGLSVISEVYPSSPADLAGLQAGDRIVRVNGQEIGRTSAIEVSAKVRGPEGSPVQITVQRDDGDLIDVTMNRARVLIPIVSSRLIDDDLGYIRIASLPHRSATIDAATEFDAALGRLLARGARGIVLDLRGNPGGDPFTSVAVASNFVPSGPIFSTVNRDGRKTTYPAVSRPTLYSGPLAVLVDRTTASGAEVVASALQEYGVGHVLGTRTCGCLSLGLPIQLGDSSGLIVTVERAFTGHDGRSLEGVGLAPDETVRIDAGRAEDTQLQQALRYLRARLP